jgi:hypothetical protein
MESVVEILRVGFSGLIFLLAFLAYRLLAKEQVKNDPDTRILNAITSYRAYTLIAALITVLVTVTSLVLEERGLSSVIQSGGRRCHRQLEQLDTILTQNPTLEELRTAAGAEVEVCRGYVSELWERVNR